jgi:molybdopterin molybdotransferase
MDGYAVGTVDVADEPVCLKVIGEVAAGRPFATPIGPGEAARIFTGGVIPAGADTVVVQELANREADRVEVLKPASKGRHIRTEGLDFRRGERLFAKGHQLTARDLALLAGMNHPLVTRSPRLRATVGEMRCNGQCAWGGQRAIGTTKGRSEHNKLAT